MRRIMVRARVRMVHSDEFGTSLVELMVSILILGLVLSSIFAVLASVGNAVSVETDRSVNVTQAGLVMQQLAKEIQSGEAFSICTNATCSTQAPSPDPSCTTPPTTACYLIVYTQTNASTRQTALPGPNAPFSCVEWRVAQIAGVSPASYVFQSRRWQLDWENNAASLVTGWRYVSTAMPTVTASFRIPTSGAAAAFGGRLLQVTVNVNNQPVSWNKTTPLSVTRELTGANILSASAPNPCIPPSGVLPP